MMPIGGESLPRSLYRAFEDSRQLPAHACATLYFDLSVIKGVALESCFSFNNTSDEDEHSAGGNHRNDWRWLPDH